MNEMIIGSPVVCRKPIKNQSSLTCVHLLTIFNQSSKRDKDKHDISTTSLTLQYHRPEGESMVIVHQLFRGKNKG